MINISKTYLPPIEEYIFYLQKIWKENIVTNNGVLVQELESRLKKYLGVRHLFFVSNGTIALQIAIRALELRGDIITTPFSYVATTSSIVWEGCRPIFVDIDPQTMCINPDLIESCITEKTTAILATHVYGYPYTCAVEQIQEIANERGLKVIYDGAHAFGVKYKKMAIVNYGDVSTLSFHATKLFHTVEGGAIITNNDDVANRVNYMRSFGHKTVEDFWGLGINGKNTELHAAMGLTILPKLDGLIKKQRSVSESYEKTLETVTFHPKISADVVYNYAYYPALFPSEELLLSAMKALNEKNVFPRRYFYPTLNTLPYVQRVDMPVAENISRRVLCLPLYPDLDRMDVLKICAVINSVISKY